MTLTNQQAASILQPEINTPENREALINAGANAAGIGWALARMRLVNPALITADNFKALITAGANAEVLGYALAQMRRANPDLITADNFQALITAGANAEQAALDIIDGEVRLAARPRPR